jgi:hypothetical protein
MVPTYLLAPCKTKEIIWKCNELYIPGCLERYLVLLGTETIRTERKPLIGEVRSTFCGWMVLRGQHDGSLRLYSQISRPELLLFLSSSSSIVLTRLSGPRSRPTTSQTIWQRRESNLDLWICSQEL